MNYAIRTLLLAVFCLSCCTQAAVAAENMRVLFLGDQGHHRPSQLSAILVPAMSQVGIDVDYTEDITSLNAEKLASYDGLLLYANIDELPAEQESALLAYVANGGGFIPLHCASYCFRNSPAFVDLVGAQFQRHGGEVFTTEIVQPEHPIMDGFGGFESWDETYIHTRHNDRNRIVLEVRRQGEQADGNTSEPWTWVRTHGKGRVFYTAWGHDERTWKHPGFQSLIERGIRWACGADPADAKAYRDDSVFPIPAMTKPRADVMAFEYDDVGPKIPNYVAGERWGVQGDVLTRMQRPLPPEESLKHYVTPQDFHLELFVSEPQIEGKPIAMNWDERGRLWICETIDYPNELMHPELGRDRIRICEDTDGDGKADKFTVFAEQLSIPTSLEFARGGVIVQAGVETLFLRDTDGDDQADERHVLISGWQMGDTHGGVSNFQYGLDNRYWAMQGYNDSKPKFAGGSHPGFRQGPFAFSVVADDRQAVVVSDVEFIRSTTNNSWGLGTSEEGLIFASTANRAPSFFVPIPNRYYERVRGWTPSLVADAIAFDHLFQPITEKVRQVDQHGGYTAGAGHALYTARTYPQSWWNRVAFVCGPTGHLVGAFPLQRDDMGYRDRNSFNLVASDDEWSAPIMAEVGPDGNMWILDWYNYIVQHNPTPQGFKTGRGNAYETDLRDKTHGRIYRLVYSGDQGQPGANVAPNLDKNDATSLVAGLGHSNRLWRRHAQRLLVERGPQSGTAGSSEDAVPALLELLTEDGVDSTGNNVAAVHALWTLHGLGALADSDGPTFESVVRALEHPAAGVRRNAALVLPPSTASTKAILDATLTKDSDAQVQLAAILALADQPHSPLAGKHLAALAQDATWMQDRIRGEAVICAAAAHAASFLSETLSQDSSSADGANASNAATAARVIAEHLARSGLDSDQLDALLQRLASGESRVAVPIIEGLAAGWPANRETELSESAEESLVKLMDGLPNDGRSPLVRLANLWGSQRMQSYATAIAAALFEKIEDSASTPKSRLDAVEELVSLMGGNAETIAKMVDAISPQMPSEIASGLVAGLANASSDNVAEELIAKWPMLTPAVRESALTTLLARPATTQDLLKAVQSGLIALTDLSLDQRQRLRSHPDRGIRAMAEKLMASTGIVLNADRQKVIEQYASVTHTVGNVAEGKLLFGKNCANCHKHSGEGNEIGPDLTGMAVHPKEELLIHVLDPNRSVEGNFRRYTLLTESGQVLSGMLAAESLTAVELVDALGKRLSISREDIEDIASTNISLMPEGFEQQISIPQMTDLMEFLTSKGRFVPLPLGSVATAVSDRPLFSDDRDGPDKMIFEAWGATTFEGVPFQLVDPQNGKRANIILLNGPLGELPPKMPKIVTLPCNMVVGKIHMLSGVSGWGFPYSSEKTLSVTVRLTYADGETEDHELLNGVHFADYIRRVDVPGSTFAYRLRGQQLRYLSIEPKRSVAIKHMDLVKGNDGTAPIVMAITLEQRL